MKHLVLLTLLLLLAGCAGSRISRLEACTNPGEAPQYLIGAGDSLQVFVWRNPELSTTVPVRPDGRLSMPLVEDMIAAGKTPSQLARDIEVVISRFIREPTVNIILTNSGGASQVQVVGSVTTPMSMPYREGMTVLDAVVRAGGLTEFAAGNRATVVRNDEQRNLQCRVRLDSLLQNGDVSQNVFLRPGDVVIVPESSF